jgi:ribosomal protein S1
VVEGVVENGASFGVFVELEPGLSGLVPVSELGMGRDVDPKTALKPGTVVRAKVMTIDSERKRISLSIRAFKQDRERSEYSGHMSSQSPEAPTTTVFGERLLKALGKRPD